jgi:hypothetical protein
MTVQNRIWSEEHHITFQQGGHWTNGNLEAEFEESSKRGANSHFS